MNLHAHSAAALQRLCLAKCEGLVTRLCRWIVWSALLLGAVVQATETRLPDVQEARLRELARELRCMVCQNEALAESHAPLAADLREEIRTQIRAGMSNQEITAYLVARYGDFVSYRPPVNGRTAFLWFGPWAVLFLLLVILWSFHKQSRRKNIPPVPEQKAHEIQAAYRSLKHKYGDRDE